MRSRFTIRPRILLAAAFFDRLDGTVARRLGLTEPLPDHFKQPRIPLGALLDDISDLVSFCIAPAAIYYMAVSGLAGPDHPTAIIAVVYFLAGGIRLIYFTLDKSPIPGFFKGMPVPAAAILTMGAIEMTVGMSASFPQYTAGLVMFCSIIMGLATVVMNLYPVKFLHIGRLMGRHPSILWAAMVIWLLGAFTPLYGILAVGIMAAYLISPLWTGRIDPAVADTERHVPRAR